MQKINLSQEIINLLPKYYLHLYSNKIKFQLEIHNFTGVYRTS